jgi:HEAT repeat protein
MVAGFASPGCKWLTDGALRELPLPPGGEPERAGQASQTQPLGPSDDPSGDRAALTRGSDAERRSVWIRAVRPPQGDSSEPDYRWRYPALEELSARGARQRPEWHRYLTDEDPVVATNAAIALARSGDDSGAERLVEAARAPGINLPMRCAAVEALAGLKGPSVASQLRELLEQYAHSVDSAGSLYHADLHAELIRGLARHVDPADDPQFVAALGSPAAAVRLEALRAWSNGRGGGLPIEVADMRADADRDVRAAALQTLARRRHGDAYQYLAAALRDHELTVRTAAIAGLGELGGTEARTTLEGLLKDQPEAIRAAAVAALEHLGAEDAVLSAAEDRSWRVRLKVARALAGYVDLHCDDIVRKLLQDPSAAVQRQVVLALTEWPLQRAGPILLEAMGSHSLTTRRAAAEQLAAQWPTAGKFPIEGPPQRRAELLDDLQRRFPQQFGPGHQDRSAEAAGREPPAAPIAPRPLDEVQQLVRQQDVAALVDFGPGLVEALEQLAFDRQQLLPEVIYRDVLPHYGQVFVALDQLESPDVAERRRAAGQLAELGREQPLGRLAVARLVRLAVAEPDQLVWQRVLTAVAGDGSEPSIRLAYAAVSHPSPEVRRRACEHLAAHPHPGHAQMLVPALDDPNHAVVCAAVRALGASGRRGASGRLGASGRRGASGRLGATAGLPSSAERVHPIGASHCWTSQQCHPPLQRLLRTTDEHLRLETAIALVRLDDPAGTAALQRLAYSTDARIRLQAAVAMGNTADAAHVPTLVHLLDDSPAVRRGALEGLSKVVGPQGWESDDQGPASTSERVRRWKQWFERREEIATGGASNGLK